MHIMIEQEIGVRCIVAEDGQKIHDSVLDTLRAGESVYLDFSGVRQFASPFFNYSLGKLFSEMPTDALRTQLHLINLNEIGSNVAERVIENALQFQTNADYRKIVDEILEQQARGNTDAS